MWTNIFLQYGTVFTSLGAIMTIYTLQFAEGGKFIIGMIISLLFVFVGFWSLKHALDMATTEQNESNKKHAELLNEIRGFRQDITNRGGENDSGNNT